MSLKHKLATVGTLLLINACGESENSDAVATTPTVGVAALAETIADCQSEGSSCVSQATSPQQAQQCNARFGECLLAVAPSRRAVARSYADCQTQARECVVRNAGMDPAGCETALEACISSVADADDADAGLPGQPTMPDAGIASVPRRPGAGSPGFPGGGTGGISGIPGFPAPGAPLPGGSFPDERGPLARQRAAYECLGAMRECVVAGAKSPMECAEEAQACIATPPSPEAGAAAPAP